MKDKKLRELLKYGELGLQEIEDILKRISRLEHGLWVTDYFFSCPSCKGEERIPRVEARKFTVRSSFMDEDIKFTAHTTERGYKHHLPLIKEMEKQAKKIKDETE